MATIRGVDISFDGDAKAIKASGRDFALAELAIGNNENPSGGRMLRAFQAAGLAGGLYVYLVYAHTNPDGTRSPTDPVAQAKAHLALLAKHPPVDLPLSIDVEQPVSASDANLPLTPKQIVDWLDAYLDVLLPGLGYAPLCYSYSSYLKSLAPALGSSRNLKKTLLWIADYDGGIEPSESYLGLIFDPHARGGSFFLPPGVNPWTSWTMIQSKGNATVPGIPHIVDTDLFRGSLADLRMLTKRRSPAPAGPVGPAVSPAPGVVPAAPVVSVTPTRGGVIAAIVAGLLALAAWWASRGR